MDFEEKLKEVNRQLEKVSIRVKGEKLYLRGRHFPPKPGETKPGRVEIAPKVSANAAGLRVALAKAKEIDVN